MQAQGPHLGSQVCWPWSVPRASVTASAWARRACRARIASENLASDDELDAVLRDAEARVASAEAFARSSPYPELAEILTDVYGD